MTDQLIDQAAAVITDGSQPNVMDLDLDTLAKRAGVTKVGIRRLELSKLRQNGVMVKVSITGSSLFTRRATFAELGIADADIRRMHYTAGSKYIFPRTLAGRFRSIENRARAAVKQYATYISGFGDWYWLPYTAIVSLRTRIEQLVAELEDLKDEMERDYPIYIDDVASEFESSARASWRSIVGQGFAAIKVNGVKYDTESEFVDYVISKILSRVPSVEDLRNRLQIDYQVQRVWGQEEIARDQANAEAIREQEALDRARLAAERERLSLQNQALRDQVSHERTLQQIEADKRQQLADVEITAELEKARARVAEEESFVDAVFQGVREKLAVAATEMLTSIQKNGFLKGKIAERGQGLLEVYATLGGYIHNDQHLEMTLRQLQNEIGPSGDDRTKKSPPRNVDQIKATLEQIVDMANNELADLSTISRADFIEF